MKPPSLVFDFGSLVCAGWPVYREIRAIPIVHLNLDSILISQHVLLGLSYPTEIFACLQ